MDTRIHSYLDGELPLEGLPPAEREQARALEALIADASAQLRRAPVPELTERVMGALPAEPPAAPERAPWLARVGRWMWHPRPIRLSLRPAVALAALVALLLVSWVLRSASTGSNSAAPMAGTAADAPQVYVQFRLEAPDASEVRLAGSFTDWEPRYQLFQTAPGVWSAVVPLQPGVHDYTFVVDGEHWITDPHALSVPDHFGGANSRLTLIPPQNGV
jgi:hypothetical protein